MTPSEMAALMARAMPGARGWTAAEFADLLSRPGAVTAGDARCFVIGQAIGDEAEIFMVLTDPALRRRGLARKALAEFHETARETGASRVILDVAADNAPALGLYDTLGYVRIAERRGYYPRGDGARIAAYLLEKRL